ncbi:MAG: hypothetical protein K0S29_1436 [Gammaproteobacteria bacterium]|nr:hypothetical protein [Gammaproteobacteria bacterium]
MKRAEKSLNLIMLSMLSVAFIGAVFAYQPHYLKQANPKVSVGINPINNFIAGLQSI